MEELPRITVWLREQKQRRKVSLRHIARFAPLSTNTVKNLLHGEVKRPTPETVAALARYFNVPRDELMVVAGYVSTVPSYSPEEQKKMTRDQLIDALLTGKSADEQLALIPDDIRADVSLSFRRVPTMPQTYDRIIEAFVRDWLGEQTTDTLERLSNQE